MSLITEFESLDHSLESQHCLKTTTMAIVRAHCRDMLLNKWFSDMLENRPLRAEIRSKNRRLTDSKSPYQAITGAAAIQFVKAIS